jgi:hypothetical protein
MLLPAADRLATTSSPNPTTVLFLAYTREELDACLRTLDACQVVRRVWRRDAWPGGYRFVGSGGALLSHRRAS